MIDREDIRAAVSAGVINESQASSIVQLADSRRGARENLSNFDEPFELFRGFNEIFIVVGLIILATGWVAANVVTADPFSSSYTVQAMISSAIAAGVVWLLAEYFVRRRRMVAPAIALTVMFWLAAGGMFGSPMWEPFMIAKADFSSTVLPLALQTLAAFGFWFRFRVPFAMALIAVSVFAIAIVFTGVVGETPEEFSDLFRLSASGPFALITITLGLVFFAIAMWFDMSDPHRVTRRASQGFWLHVVAAPALVNTIALSLLESDTGLTNLALFMVLVLFTIVAIVIDRRSFLMAAIGYIVALSATVFKGDGAAFTILMLGIILVVLGAFWQQIRANLLSIMPGFIPLDRLPPSHTQDAK